MKRRGNWGRKMKKRMWRRWRKRRKRKNWGRNIGDGKKKEEWRRSFP